MSTFIFHAASIESSRKNNQKEEGEPKYRDSKESPDTSLDLQKILPLLYMETEDLVNFRAAVQNGNLEKAHAILCHVKNSVDFMQATPKRLGALARYLSSCSHVQPASVFFGSYGVVAETLPPYVTANMVIEMRENDVSGMFTDFFQLETFGEPDRPKKNVFPAVSYFRLPSLGPPALHGKNMTGVKFDRFDPVHVSIICVNASLPARSGVHIANEACSIASMMRYASPIRPMNKHSFVFLADSFPLKFEDVFFRDNSNPAGKVWAQNLSRTLAPHLTRVGICVSDKEATPKDSSCSYFIVFAWEPTLLPDMVIQTMACIRSIHGELNPREILREAVHPMPPSSQIHHTGRSITHCPVPLDPLALPLDVENQIRKYVVEIDADENAAPAAAILEMRKVLAQLFTPPMNPVFSKMKQHMQLFAEEGAAVIAFENPTNPNRRFAPHVVRADIRIEDGTAEVSLVEKINLYQEVSYQLDSFPQPSALSVANLVINALNAYHSLIKK